MINIFFSKLNIKTIQIILLIIGCILIIISLYCFNAYLVSESNALTNTTTTTTTTTINNKSIEKFNTNTNTNTTSNINTTNTSNTINTTNTTPTTTSNITTPEYIIPSTTLISYADTINNNIPQSGMTSSINNNNNKKNENLEPNLTTVGTNLYVSQINNNVVNNKIKSDVFPLIRIE